MEPAFQRGDILFLNNQDDPIRVGEIVVFKIKDRDIPIVHRVLEVHEKYVQATKRMVMAAVAGPIDPGPAKLDRPPPLAHRNPHTPGRTGRLSC